MIGLERSLGLWIPQVTGRYINEDWEPQTQGYGAQCWDIPANWSKYLGLPVISTGSTATKRGRWPGWAGNMVDAFPQSAAIAAAYELLPPSATVVGGDILVWGDGNPAMYPKTHTAVGVADKGALVLCMSQNSSASLADNPYPQWTTGPTILQHLPKAGLIGIIRPRTADSAISAQSSTTTSEEDDPLAGFSRADLVQIAAEGTIQALQTKGEMQDGRSMIDHLNQMRTEVGNTKASVEHIPATILYEQKEDGRCLFDWLKQLRADIYTSEQNAGGLDIPALAKVLSEQLADADVHALAAQLQISVKEAPNG
jgi:hypothetical protein